MASKRTKYIMGVITLGSLAWSMMSLPATLSQVHAGMPGHASRTGDDESPNDFDSVPDVESLLDLASSGAADDDVAAITLFEAQSTMTHEEQQDALKAQRHKRAHHR